jgi:glycosyltransferase involved in cell wall biosynthesis
VTTSEVRVLHVLPDVREIGNGIVDVTVDLAIAQAVAGLHVVVASAGGEYEQLLVEHGVQTVRLVLRPGGLPAMRRIVRDVRPSVIHTHTLKGLVLARLAASGCPVLTTAHRDLGRWSVAMRLATRVVSVSKGIADSLARFVPRERIVVVPNGVLGSARRAHLLDVAPAQFSHPAVVYVGGIYEHKGVGVLLEAFAELLATGRDAGATLHVVGDGPDRGRFEMLAESLGISGRVQWAGFRRDAYAWIRAADVFVLPSLLETFGLVLAEARQAGVAIVAAATGGVPETLDEGRAGLLVRPGDAPALAAALHTVLTDEDERARLRAAGAADTGWLTVDRMLQDVLREYADVLDLVESGQS